MKNIYVGNLSFQTTPQDIESAFSAYGHVESVNVIRDRDTGQSRGFAFVEMSVDSEADQAVAALNGADLDGRQLKVMEARPREERGGGGFGKAPQGNRGRKPGGRPGRSRREPRW